MLKLTIMTGFVVKGHIFVSFHDFFFVKCIIIRNGTKIHRKVHPPNFHHGGDINITKHSACSTIFFAFPIGQEN